ncbi:Uncharacterised protein [Bordetella pertussis]|nr:Uncharacterised protein [Bordetella pertussis]CPL53496.1 Uncharacterised protein [Bordetella pertussis]
MLPDESRNSRDWPSRSVITVLGSTSRATRCMWSSTSPSA